MLHKASKYAATVSTVAEMRLRLGVGQSTRQIAQWMTHRLQQLGPTYVKVGQFVASRKDIFGPDITEELSQLKDRVAPFPSGDVAVCLSRNEALSRVLAAFEDQPLASASIGQVHRATLKDGRSVVVKVRRPGIEGMVKDDIGFLILVLRVVERFGVQNIADSLDSVRNFERAIMSEISFEKELCSMRDFHRRYNNLRLTGDGAVRLRIPAVYPELSDAETIVMEYVPSRPIGSFAGDRRELSFQLMNFFIRQLVTDGVIHGDPHLGNMGLTSGGDVVLYDFGNTVQVSSIDRQRLKELILQLLIGNNTAVMKTMGSLGIKVSDPREMSSYVTRYIDYMKTIDIQRLKPSSHTPQTKLPFTLPDDIVRLIRVYGIMEGTCKELCPQFNYFDLIQNYMQDMLLDEEFLFYKISADMDEVFDMFLKLR